jgi:hypothetical protein
MKNLLYLNILIALLTTSYNAFSQKTIEKGFIKMEITKVGSDDPEMDMMLSAMKGTQTDVYFKDEQYITSMDMMGGMMKMKVQVDKTSNRMNMLMDMMGQKTWVESGLDERSEEQKQVAASSKITYDKKDTKEILGYKCYKVTVTNPEMEGTTVTGYVTEDIKTKANIIQGFQSLEFAGFTMEYTIANPQVTMTMTAVEVSDKVDDAMFMLDTKGYKKMTMEEFQKTMGGMGGNLGF